jgi:RNA polymerase sigma-70 factor (ECF subfamily)
VEAIKLKAVTSARPDPLGDDRGHPALVHADALYHLAWHLTRGDGEAEDLVQESFARALRSWSRFEPGTNLKAWLLCILRNTWLDARRHRRRSPVALSQGDDLEDGASRPGGEDCLRDDPELEFMRGLVARDIEDALGHLREEQRTAILLDLEGLTEAEMATVLGCAAGTVKSRLSRARAELRTRLADYRRQGPS